MTGSGRDRPCWGWHSGLLTPWGLVHRPAGHRRQGREPWLGCGSTGQMSLRIPKRIWWPLVCVSTEESLRVYPQLSWSKAVSRERAVGQLVLVGCPLGRARGPVQQPEGHVSFSKGCFFNSGLWFGFCLNPGQSSVLSL